VGVEGSGHESVGLDKLSFTDIQVGANDSKRQQKKKGKRQTVSGWWKLMISSRSEKGAEGKRAEGREREGEMAVRSI